MTAKKRSKSSRREAQIENDLQEDFSPAFVARRQADIAVAYCLELKRRAVLAGLAEHPLMQQKIKDAESYECEALSKAGDIRRQL
ncbi:MAG: hypothetical protein IKN81_10425 [Oscillospiraceae bacterium]|nr:hypothetical protein [Oscillospiraceae bacterium]